MGNYCDGGCGENGPVNENHCKVCMIEFRQYGRFKQYCYYSDEPIAISDYGAKRCTLVKYMFGFTWQTAQMAWQRNYSWISLLLHEEYLLNLLHNAADPSSVAETRLIREN